MHWNPSHAFRTLLVSQLALILVYPLLGEAWGLNFLLGIFLIGALYGGISITLAKPRLVWTGMLLGVCFVGSYWAARIFEQPGLQLVGPVFGAAFFLFIAVLMMRHIFFYRSNVNVDLIYGTISAYLLIGNAFAEMYVALALFDPGAFAGLDMTKGFDHLARTLSYYSFVTLTTLGYGDVAPLKHYARVLAYVEAIVGQLYLTILVARLVGTYIAQSQRDEP